MLKDVLFVTNEGGHTVFHDQLQKLEVVSAPFLDHFQIHVEVFGINGIQSYLGFWFAIYNIDHLHLVMQQFYCYTM
jgi:hypothetical protein